MANPIAVPGTIVPSGSLTTPGGAQGVQGPTAVSTDAGNIAILGSDSLILVPQSSLWSMRLRSFNAIGNQTFEVDQRNIGNTVANPSGLVIDRWALGRTGTFAVSAGQQAASAGINLPGTNFAITRSFFRVTVTTAASLAAGDYLILSQYVEGPQWRELQNDAHSFQIYARSSVANLAFGVALRDGTPSKSLTNLLTLPATPNTWALLALPNLPIWPAGNFSNAPGVAGYILTITLACGATNTTPANGTWQTGSFFGAVGQSNLAATSNATFDVCYVGHEPGSICTTPQDCPFTTNLQSALRYYQKSFPYASAVGATNTGSYSYWNSNVSVSSSTFNVYGGPRWAVPMAKAPTCVVYHPNTGTANQGLIWYATTGTIPTASGPQGVNIYAPSTNSLSVMTMASGTSSCPIPVIGEWTSDTGW